MFPLKDDSRNWVDISGVDERNLSGLSLIRTIYVLLCHDINQSLIGIKYVYSDRVKTFVYVEHGISLWEYREVKQGMQCSKILSEDDCI